MTAIKPQSKPDTVLLLDKAEAPGAPQTDYSQSRTPLTNNTTNLRETGSSRTALNAPREITLVWDLRTGDTGILLQHGSMTGIGYQISIGAGGTLDCIEQGSVRVSAALPNLIGSDRKFLISWCQHRDGSSVRSELLIYNFAVPAFAFVTATHASTTTSAGASLTIGASYDNSNQFSDPLDFYFVRIGRRFHSTTEQREDWIPPATTPPAGITQIRRGAPLVPKRSSLPGVVDHEAFAGPAHLWSGHVFEQADRRLVGPLVNVRPFSPIVITHLYNTPPGWWRAAYDDADFHLCLSLLWYRPVPSKVNRARVRLFVRQDSPLAGAVAAVYYRMYSLINLPVDGLPGAPEGSRTPTATCSVMHGSGAGAGQWLDLGELPLRVDEYEHTWLAVGVAMDEDSPNVGSTQTAIFAITVDPYFEPSGNGSMDTEEP